MSWKKWGNWKQEDDQIGRGGGGSASIGNDSSWAVRGFYAARRDRDELAARVAAMEAEKLEMEKKKA